MLGQVELLIELAKVTEQNSNSVRSHDSWSNQRGNL